MKTNVKVVLRVAFLGVLVLSLPFAATTLPSVVAAWNAVDRLFTNMSVSEVCRRWGERPLDVAVFRSAEEDESARAAMACSLLKNQDDYVGMHPREIMPLFGNHTGYYYTEGVPTYLIETATAQDSWQIVFLLDRDRRVSEVFVHKICC